MKKLPVAKTNQWRARFDLASSVVALMHQDCRTIGQIEGLVHQLEIFLRVPQTNFEERVYPGENGNYCNGCGYAIDPNTHLCPNGTDHERKIPGGCANTPDPNGRLLILIGEAITKANREERSLEEIVALMKALQEFKNAPSATKEQKNLFNQFGGKCPECGHAIDEGGHCGCPASVQ